MRCCRFIMLFSLMGCAVEASLVSPGTTQDTSIDPNAPIPPDVTPPNAICGFLPTSTVPGEPVQLIGENSFDPDGLDVTQYRWELALRPDGSRAELPAATGSAPNLDGFVPDAIGEYVATLEVTNQLGGMSTPCSTTLVAAPEQRLWIELTWEWPDENLDLHLLEEGATPGSAGDCGGADCTKGLEWGQPGPDDNPVVLTDDIKGTGPEVLALTTPAAGTYTVVIVDNNDLRRMADNVAEARIYVDGTLAYQTAVTVSNENSATPIAAVTFPAGTVSAIP